MEQNAIERVLANNFADSGWEGLNNATNELTEQAKADQAQARFERALEIARPFMSAEGGLALQRLRERTVYTPTWDPQAGGAMEGAAAGFAREGQNSIIRFIEDCIRIAEAGPPQAPAKGDAS